MFRLFEFCSFQVEIFNLAFPFLRNIDIVFPTLTCFLPCHLLRLFLIERSPPDEICLAFQYPGTDIPHLDALASDFE